MRVFHAAGIVLLAAVSVLPGCAGSGGGGGGGGPKCKAPAQPTISYANNVQPIYNRSCAVAAGCHASSGPAQGLDLSAGKSYGQSVNVKSTEQPKLKRIDPGKPDSSYIVQKIEGTPGISGVLMPQGCPGTPLNGAQCLSADDISCIRQWVTECAPNN